jgi:hypothetical protein
MRSVLKASAMAIVALSLCAAHAGTPGDAQPTNALPNPYRTIAPWGKLPDGRK